MANSDGTITWRELWANTTEILRERHVARWLCETASGCDVAEFESIQDDLVNSRSGLHLEAMVRRVLDGEPVQYVMGRWAFRHLDLMVDSRVLIPRPETELIVDHVMRYVRDVPTPHVIADLGTGSGAIGLSLLHELPLGTAVVWMTDASQDALDVARANAAGIGRPASGARFALGSWWKALPTELRGSLTAVVSNPPYIEVGDTEVDKSVVEYEPHSALFSGADGLDDIRELAAGAREWLTPGGFIIVEMGHAQSDAVKTIFNENGLTEIVTLVDLAGRPRFTSARTPL